MDGLLGGPILFDAVRVDGLVSAVTIWGVPRQGKPFAPLAEVATT